MVRGGAQHRHQHQVLGTGGGRRPDQGVVAVAVDRLGAGPARAHQAVDRRDHRRAAGDGRGQRGRVPQVAGDELGHAGQPAGTAGVAGEHPDGLALPGELADDPDAERARAAGDQDHAVTAPASVPAPTTRAVWASTSPLVSSTGSR